MKALIVTTAAALAIAGAGLAPAGRRAGAGADAASPRGTAATRSGQVGRREGRRRAPYEKASGSSWTTGPDSPRPAPTSSAPTPSTQDGERGAPVWACGRGIRPHGFQTEAPLVFAGKTLRRRVQRVRGLSRARGCSCSRSSRIRRSTTRTTRPRLGLGRLRPKFDVLRARMQTTAGTTFDRAVHHRLRHMTQPGRHAGDGVGEDSRDVAFSVGS